MSYNHVDACASSTHSCQVDFIIIDTYYSMFYSADFQELFAIISLWIRKFIGH
jgi:hypothetical protein